MTVAVMCALGRVLLHARTIELVFEPALADAHFEQEARPRSGTLAYAAASALARGIWHDLVWEDRRPVWYPAAAALVTTGALLAFYQASMLTLMLGMGSRWRPLANAAAGWSWIALGEALAVVFSIGVVCAVRHARDARGH